MHNLWKDKKGKFPRKNNSVEIVKTKHTSRKGLYVIRTYAFLTNSEVKIAIFEFLWTKSKSGAVGENK